MKFLTYLRIGFGLSVAGGAILYGGLLAALGAKPARALNAVARILAGPVLRIARIRVISTGGEKLKEAGPALVVYNQQSVLCYCIYATLFQQVPNSGLMARLTGKWDIPPLTYYYRRTGNFMVDPGNPLRTAVGFVDARQALVEKGARIWMGPEGTRWGKPGILGPFKPGAFRLAIEAHVPIVPLVISPLKPRTDLWAPRLESHEVELRVLDPIPTEGLTLEDVTDLRDSVRTLMQKACSEMVEERRNSP